MTTLSSGTKSHPAIRRRGRTPIIDVFIYGAGGVGKGALQIIRDINAAAASPRYRVIGFLDANPEIWGSNVQGLEVVGDHGRLGEYGDAQVVIAIANPAAKARTVKILRGCSSCRFAALVHPLAWLAHGVAVGQGSIIYPFVTANTEARIGDFTLLNMHSTLGHDAWLEDYCTLGPGARVLGAAQVHEGADLGANSVVLSGAVMGAWSVLGAGAVAIRSIPDRTTAVGVPAVVIKQWEVQAAELP